jgi:hypothetical protein
VCRFFIETDKEHLLWHRFEGQVSVNGFNGDGCRCSPGIAKTPVLMAGKAIVL